MLIFGYLGGELVQADPVLLRGMICLVLPFSDVVLVIFQELNLDDVVTNDTV